MAVGDVFDPSEVRLASKDMTPERVYDPSEVVAVPSDLHGPSFVEGLKAGFAQQPIKAEGMLHPANIGHFIGDTALPTAGAIAGEIVNPLGGGVVGAAAGRALQKTIAQTTGMAPVQKPTEIAADIMLTGAFQKAGEMAAPAVGAGAKAATKWSKDLAIKSLGWASDIGPEGMKFLSRNPEAIMSKIGKVTKFDVTDAENAMLKSFKAGQANLTKEELTIADTAIKNAKDSGDMAGYLVNKLASDPDLEGIFVKAGAESHIADYVTTKVAADASKWGPKIDFGSGAAGVAALAGNIKTGGAMVAAQSPRIASGIVGGTAKAAKAVENFVAKKAMLKHGPTNKVLQDSIEEYMSHGMPAEEAIEAAFSDVDSYLAAVKSSLYNRAVKPAMAPVAATAASETSETKSKEDTKE